MTQAKHSIAFEAHYRSLAIPQSGILFSQIMYMTRDGFAFALLRFVIGLEYSHHFLNQSESNWLKPITTWSLAFSRASDSFLVFHLIFHWLIVIFSFLWLAFQIALVLVLWQWMEKRSKKSRSITATPQSQCPSPTPPLPNFTQLNDIVI